MSFFSKENFLFHIQQITQLETRAQVVRFFFINKSITIPIHALEKHAIDVLKFNESLIYPDFLTLFYDPCSVQETLCVLCSLVNLRDFSCDDDRALVMQTNNSTAATCTFVFTITNHNALQDIFHDLRTEIAIESMKAGVSVLAHYLDAENRCCISFIANTTLSLADGIQKLRSMIYNIAFAYNQTIDISLDKSFFVININNDKISKITQEFDANSYSIIKNLQL